MIKDLIDKDLRINELEQKIEDAIEYINKYSFKVSDMEEPPFELNVIETKELLEMLGDNENE